MRTVTSSIFRAGTEAEHTWNSVRVRPPIREVAAGADFWKQKNQKKGGTRGKSAGSRSAVDHAGPSRPAGAAAQLPIYEEVPAAPLSTRFQYKGLRMRCKL